MKFAVLGTSDAISRVELEEVIGKSSVLASQDVALFESEDSCNDLQQRLGGTQKLGEIIGLVHSGSEKELVSKMLEEISKHTFDAKIRIGMSVYNINDLQLRDRLFKASYRLQMDLKRALKEEEKSVRIVTSKHPTLHSAAIKKNKLIEKGVEFVLITTQKGVYLGSTKTIQDLDEWSYRDMKRPWRNAKQGMLPPKLARMMVNLSGVTPSTDHVLLDPFCGSGTTLMEAGIVGFSIKGSDINEQAIHDTRLNLEWVKQKGFVEVEPELFTSSADNMHHLLTNNSIDLIVTEPFLGAPRKGNEGARDVAKAVEDLERLYTRCFRSLYEVLKPGGRLVISNPVHFVGRETLEPKTIEILNGIGFKQVSFSKDLLYKRDGQYVGRHMLRFEK